MKNLKLNLNHLKKRKIKSYKIELKRLNLSVKKD